MPRRTFRQGVVAGLKASASVTALCPAANVFDSRTTRIPVGTMPSIVVFVSRTRRTKLGNAATVPTFRVVHSLSIDCFAKGDTDEELAENLDLLSEAVLDELLGDGDFVAQFEEVEGASEEVVLEGDSDNRFGLCRLTLDVTISECYEPRTTDDLVTVHSDFDVDGDGVDSDPDDVSITITDLDA